MEETESVVELPARRNLDEGGNNDREEVSSLEESSLAAEEEELFQLLMETGGFYGRSKSRTNPLMKEYILATRSGFEVIDLQQTISGLQAAAKVIEETVKSNGLILLVGLNSATKSVVKEMATKLGLPYVTERWLGGTLTNFKVIAERVNQFKKTKEDLAAGRLEKYTKKEQLKMERELAKLEVLFGGLEKLDKFPSLLLVADLASDELPAKEAKQKGVPVIAFLNTDADPTLADYRVPINDRNPESVKLLINYLEEVITKAKMNLVRSANERQENSS